MALYHEDIVDIDLENGTLHRSFLNHSIGYGDDLANRFGVRAFRNGEPETLGGTCAGYFIRADGATVAIDDGVVSGNLAYVTLPEACYAVEGNFTLAIKVSGSGVVGTMRIVDGVVSRTSTSAAVDPGNIIPDIEDLIDAINDAVESIPADYSGLLAGLNDYRDTFSGNFDDGNLFDIDRCTENEYVVPETGALTPMSGYVTTGYIPVEQGKTYHYLNITNAGVITAATFRSVAEYNKNLVLITGDTRNVTTYTPDEGVAYIRVTVSAFGDKNAIVSSVGGTYISGGYADYPYSVNSKYIDSLKFAVPLTKTSFGISQDGTSVTITSNSRFITDDQRLSSNISGTFTFTLVDTLQGIAVDMYSNTIVKVAPTVKAPADRYCYLCVYYGYKPIMYSNDIAEYFTTPNKTNGIIFGCVFAWLAGNNLYMSGTYNATLIYNGVSDSAFNSAIRGNVQSYSYPLSTQETIRYIYYDRDGVHTGINVPDNAYVLAYVYNYQIFPKDDRIIANTLPLLKVMQRADTPTFINYRRLGYRVLPAYQLANDQYNAFFGDEIRVTNGYSASEKPVYVWDNDDNLNAMNVQFVQNTSSISSKKILTVGDSITARGWFQHYISEACGATFVGTQTSIYYSMKCEGYSGRNIAYVLGSSGPFWNSSTSEIDFENYCTTNNIAPDIVTIMFGLNETESTKDYIEGIQAFIDSIHEYNSDISVYVIIPFGEAEEAWYGTGVIAASRFSKMRLYQCSCYALTDCTLIPGYYVINDKTDYAKHSVQYGVGSLSFDVIDDGVHPDEATGFKKLANIVYNYLQ